MQKKGKKKKNHFITAFFTTFLICLAAFSAIFAFNLDSINKLVNRDPAGAIKGSHNPAQANHDASNVTVKPVSKQTFDKYIEETYFVGDSRTNGLLIDHLVPQSNVYAINGANHQTARTKKFVNLGNGKLLTIAQAIGVKKPKRVIVSFGINGVAFMGQSKFMSEYEAFIDELIAQSPNSTFAIQSILPVSVKRAKDDPRMANKIIDDYNQRLKTLADKKGCIYLDTSFLLKDSKNSLASKYDCGDGLHFSQNAYTVLLDYMDQYRID